MPLTFLDDFRSAPHVQRMLQELDGHTGLELKIMEVCGTHTMAISRHGIRQAVPEGITLISGPGCPVCVTANADIDRFIETALIPGVIAASFGDMLRVPGTRMGLAEARSHGADVRIVYSPLDALAMARDNPGRDVVFFGVGFETTAPTVAATVMAAREQGLDNFYIQPVHKLVPPALEALCALPRLAIDAFLCPGHVSAIIGPGAYEAIASEHEVPCVIAGFEPVDILQALSMLAVQVESGRADVELQYTRGVRAAGNPEAMALMYQVFETADAEWRGLGTIPGSGLVLREEYSGFDAGVHYQVDTSYSREPRGCICGEILTGLKTPRQCGLFRKACDPDHPVGPCMVSSEGTCAAYFQYED
jgi:hydrogenase expression/formation protein HypD